MRQYNNQQPHSAQQQQQQQLLVHFTGPGGPSSCNPVVTQLDAQQLLQRTQLARAGSSGHALAQLPAALPAAEHSAPVSSAGATLCSLPMQGRGCMVQSASWSSFPAGALPAGFTAHSSPARPQVHLGTQAMPAAGLNSTSPDRAGTAVQLSVPDRLAEWVSNHQAQAVQQQDWDEDAQALVAGMQGQYLQEPTFTQQQPSHVQPVQAGQLDGLQQQLQPIQQQPLPAAWLGSSNSSQAPSWDSKELAVPLPQAGIAVAMQLQPGCHSFPAAASMGIKLEPCADADEAFGVVNPSLPVQATVAPAPAVQAQASEAPSAMQAGFGTSSAGAGGSSGTANLQQGCADAPDNVAPQAEAAAPVCGIHMDAIEDLAAQEQAAAAADDAPASTAGLQEMPVSAPAQAPEAAVQEFEAGNCTTNNMGLLRGFSISRCSSTSLSLLDALDAAAAADTDSNGADVLLDEALLDQALEGLLQADEDWQTASGSPPSDVQYADAVGDVQYAAAVDTEPATAPVAPAAVHGACGLGTTPTSPGTAADNKQASRHTGQPSWHAMPTSLPQYEGSQAGVLQDAAAQPGNFTASGLQAAVVAAAPFGVVTSGPSGDSSTVRAGPIAMATSGASLCNTPLQAQQHHLQQQQQPVSCVLGVPAQHMLPQQQHWPLPAQLLQQPAGFMQEYQQPAQQWDGGSRWEQAR